MKREPTHHTLIKIVTTRKTREMLTLAKILMFLLMVLGLVFIAQVGVCKYENSRMTVRECIAPRIHKGN